MRTHVIRVADVQERERAVMPLLDDFEIVEENADLIALRRRRPVDQNAARIHERRKGWLDVAFNLVLGLLGPPVAPGPIFSADKGKTQPTKAQLIPPDVDRVEVRMERTNQGGP